ncbi:hypothetical protein S1OALGB6SA_862 [Olavius algarvensis spirochete endosymbiont]|nr:hypothetical protein S1OALGB6SA_862 [Olavius algarvensis spirochete endosymbiont]
MKSLEPNHSIRLAKLSYFEKMASVSAFSHSRLWEWSCVLAD